MAKYQTSFGYSSPLGSTYDGQGVNFALFSAHAQKVELCLFDESGAEELERYEITEQDNNVWHIYLKGAKAGLVYGWRVYGLYDPLKGYRFNPNKLLIDPYGKQLRGTLIWNRAIFAYDWDSSDGDLSFSELDSAPYVPKTVVVDNDYNWEGENRPHYDMADTIIYETHLRGSTRLNPFLDDGMRGTFAAFSQASTINYLKHLGVTSVEFLPIHAFFGNRRKRGFVIDNYWGYESLSFFAPEPSYLASGDIKEVKDTIKKLHSRGLEVFLDVVYNHTIEGNHMGPTLSWRGIDNQSYYILDEENPRFYKDTTGCGASLNLQNRDCLRMVMDSLRYWVRDMHIDGFRFDLAPTLCRRGGEFKQSSGFLYTVTQDELLQNTKMIAEPWDVGEGGYQLGAFPINWGEWNDRYRDNIRRIWKGDEGQIADFASRLTGSSEVFNHYNRGINSSINFITAHDGFTLYDLVSYQQKHNSANGEQNHDGSDSNWSWNSGAEGDTTNPIIMRNRKDRMKAMLATLMLSFGTPMLTFGDELARTQMGNNNPYCQDNAINWLSWEGLSPWQHKMFAFTRKVIKLRKELGIFNRHKFFSGYRDEEGYEDIAWYTQSGKEFTDSDWQDAKRHCLSYLVRHNNEFVFAIFNAYHQSTKWILPDLPKKMKWHLLLDTSERLDKEVVLGSSKSVDIPSWSVVVIKID